VLVAVDISYKILNDLNDMLVVLSDLATKIVTVFHVILVIILRMDTESLNVENQQLLLMDHVQAQAKTGAVQALEQPVLNHYLGVSLVINLLALQL